MAHRTVFESISRRRVVSASPQSSAYDAACLMAKGHCGSILIIDDSGSLLGIFTERDLMARVVARSLDPKSTPLSDVMTPNPKSVTANTSVYDAVFLMKECGFRHLPILALTGLVIGVFSIRDALPCEIIEANDLFEHLDRQFADVLA